MRWRDWRVWKVLACQCAFRKLDLAGEARLAFWRPSDRYDRYDRLLRSVRPRHAMTDISTETRADYGVDRTRLYRPSVNLSDLSRFDKTALMNLSGYLSMTVKALTDRAPDLDSSAAAAHPPSWQLISSTIAVTTRCAVHDQTAPGDRFIAQTCK
jgi:hypothetical protein